MAILYKRINELDNEAAISLAHYIETDISTDAKTKKTLISALSDLIDSTIRGDIITDAVADAIAPAVAASIAAIEAVGGLAPVGSIKMFGGAAAPTGWILCDNASLLRAGTYADLFAIIGVVFGSVDGTHFNVPDFRGIFPRGAGTSDKLTNANAVAFAGVLGTYENDKGQGHHHNVNWGLTGGGTAGATAINSPPSGNIDMTTSPETDGVNGVPRTGSETNPANLGINFIIKY